MSTYLNKCKKRNSFGILDTYPPSSQLSLTMCDFKTNHHSELGIFGIMEWAILGLLLHQIY